MFIHAGGFNLVEDLWERGQLGEFLIATPNAGASVLHQFARWQGTLRGFSGAGIFAGDRSALSRPPGRANRGVSGVSMGGYGALHLALRHPELFSAVSAHSPAIIDKLPAFIAPTPAAACARGCSAEFSVRRPIRRSGRTTVR